MKWNNNNQHQRITRNIKIINEKWKKSENNENENIKIIERNA